MAKKKDTEKNATVELQKFEGKDTNGKSVKVSAPVDSLDKHAEEALQGIFRSC